MRSNGRTLGFARLLAGLACLLPSALALAADTAAPVITHVPVAHAPEGEAIAIRARIDDDSEVFAPSVYVRPVGAKEYDNIAMRKVLDAFEAIVPAEQVDSDLEYFIEAFDEVGNGPAREGSPDAPLRISLYDPAKGPPAGVVTAPPPLVAPPPPSPPPPQLVTTPPEDPEDDSGITSKWWFWTIIGVVVVAGATTGVVLASGKDAPVEFVDIEIAGPDPTVGL